MDDGAELSLWDTGGLKTPLVFIHGFPEDHHCWDNLLHKFGPQILKKYRIITYDLRGFGQSFKTGEASLNRFFCDLQNIVSFLGLPQYHLVGHDWGGAIALHTAKYLPESLVSLFVLNTNYWKTDFFGMWHLTFLNLPLIPRMVFRWYPELMYEFGLEKAYAHPEHLDEKTKKNYRKMFCDRATVSFWLKLYHNMAKTLAAQTIPGMHFLLKKSTVCLPERSPEAYHVPTTLIWGVKDRFNPVWIGRDMEKKLLHRGAAVKLHLVGDAGHFVQEDQPGEIARIIADNLKTNIQ